MITKMTILHQGWSHDNGEDKYDNVSIGSTKATETGKNLDQKSRKTKEKTQNGIIGSSDNVEMTDNDEHGWTKIKTNGSRKPKMKSTEQPIIDSIIATINVETKTVKNGSLEVKIASPVRRNRCIIPDKTEREDETAYDITMQLTKQAPTTEEEEEDEEEEEKKIESPTRQIRRTTTDGIESDNAIEFELNSRNQCEQRLLPPGKIADNNNKKKRTTTKEKMKKKRQKKKRI